MKEQYKLPILIISLLLLGLFGIGLSYGLYVEVNEASDYYAYSVDCLNVIATDEVYESKLSVMNDSDGVLNDPYMVAITNNCEESKEVELRFNISETSNVLASTVKLEIQGHLESEAILYESLINSASRKNENVKASKILGSLSIESGKTVRINVRTWLDEFNSNEELNSLIGTIEVSDSKTTIKPVFKDVLLTNSSLGMASDSYGTSYYFSGDVINNYVYFANQLFRIVRINGDGTIRLVLENTPLVSAFNTYSNNSMYLGYSYLNEEENVDSTIKVALDTWYNDNLSQYSDYIYEGAYCNDLTLEQGLNVYGVDYYASNTRVKNNEPSLKCNTSNDKIGLLSVDEVMLARGDNTSYYLNNGTSFYTSSPSRYSYNTGYMYGVNSYGGIVEQIISYNMGVRPVINLNNFVTVTGTGTLTDPYLIDIIED